MLHSASNRKARAVFRFTPQNSSLFRHVKRNVSTMCVVNHILIDRTKGSLESAMKSLQAVMHELKATVGACSRNGWIHSLTVGPPLVCEDRVP